MNQKAWDKLEKSFYDNLQDYFNDLYGSIIKLRVNVEPYNPHARSQLCIAFIAIDTFSRFSEIFKGVRGEDLNKDNRKRFKNWVSEYILTNRNDVYKDNCAVLKMDDDLLWKMRNSLLHFYSFPKSDGETKLGFVFDVSKEYHKKIEWGMKESGHKCNFIDSHFLIQAIFSGFVLFMLDLKKQMRDSPQDYIEAVKYAHEIVLHENMKTILIQN